MPPWSRTLLEKPVFAELGKKFPDFCHYRVRDWTLRWTRWTQFTFSRPASVSLVSLVTSVAACHISDSLSPISHLGCPGSSPCHVIWDLWLTKWHWGRFSPNTSVSPANSHSTNCSTLIIYHPWLITIGQLMAEVPSGLSLTPHRETKKKSNLVTSHLRLCRLIVYFMSVFWLAFCMHYLYPHPHDIPRVVRRQNCRS
jgi:hypothetical protein